MKSVDGFKECEDGAQEFGLMVKGKLMNKFSDV
jgi:hypothetical protein